MSHRTVYLWERESGDLAEIEVEFECSTYYPAKTWGPPDSCYPAEGGEIESLKFDCEDPAALAEFVAAYKADASLQERVDEACFDVALDAQYHDGPDYY